MCISEHACNSFPSSNLTEVVNICVYVFQNKFRGSVEKGRIGKYGTHILPQPHLQTTIIKNQLKSN